MRARPFVAALAIALPAIGIGVACTFPSPAIVADDGGGSSGTSGSSGGQPDGADLADAAPITIDGADPDVLVVKDAGSKVDAAGCGATNCDCDGDDFPDTTKLACAEAGANDCDDHDTRTRPNQGWLDIPAESPQFGDWNCDKVVDKLYKVGLDCTTISTVAHDCTTDFGFSDTPECGQTGNWVRCVSGGLFCKVGKVDTTVKQACK